MAAANHLAFFVATVAVAVLVSVAADAWVVDGVSVVAVAVSVAVVSVVGLSAYPSLRHSSFAMSSLSMRHCKYFLDSSRHIRPLFLFCLRHSKNTFMAALHSPGSWTLVGRETRVHCVRVRVRVCMRLSVRVCGILEGQLTVMIQWKAAFVRWSGLELLGSSTWKPHVDVDL